MSHNHPLDAYRNSHMDFCQVYFWTGTIHNWKRLLTPDKYKQIIIDSWGELVKRGKIAVYAFVIMPNHLHVVWEMLEANGKEMPHASFNKKLFKLLKSGPNWTFFCHADEGSIFGIYTNCC